jgi:translocation and assembly module TamB
MAKSKRVKLEVDLPDDAVQDRDEAAPSPRRGSRLGWLGSRLLVMLVLAAILALFAPMIVAGSGLWKSLLAWGAPDLAGKIEIGRLSLAWWSPVEIQQLTIRDEQGTLAEIPRLRSQKSLFALATGYPNLGTFELESPRVRIELRADGSNVEDLLAALASPDDQQDSSNTAIGVGLVVTGGSIELDDRIAGRTWLLDQVNADLAWPAAADQLKTGKLEALALAVGAATAEGQRATAPAGELSAALSWQPGADADGLGSGDVELKLAGLATELAEGALRRFVADLRPAGRLTLDAHAAWTADGASQQLVVRQLAAPELTLAAPTLLGTDRVAASITTGQADVLLTADQIEIKQLMLATNLGTLEGKGAAPLAALSSAGTSISSAANSADIEVTGRIDLAALARQMPATLHMRENTQLTRGAVQVTLASQQDSAGRKWRGAIRTDRIEAVSPGGPIVLDEPLTADFALRLSERGPALEEFTGRANFLDLRGGGTLQQGTITADVNLDRLVADLAPLVDWSGIELAGTLGAQLRWNQEENDEWTARGDAKLQNFAAAAAGMTPWRENDLTVGIDLGGLLAGASLDQLRRGTLTITSGDDRLSLELAEPVSQVSAASVWPLRYTMQGQLATWMPRAQPFVSLAGWQFAGKLDAQGAGRFSPTLVEVGTTTIEVQDLQVAGPGLWIREPIARITTAGSWNQEEWKLVLPSTTVESTSLALRADDVRLMATGAPTVVGVIDFRGDPAKLSQWIGSIDAPRTWQLAGELTGRVEIADRGNRQEATLQADVDNFQFLTMKAEQPSAGPRTSLAANSTAPAYVPAWAEKKVSLRGQASYNADAAAVNLARGSVATDWGEVVAAGTIADLFARCVVDLSGELAYDLSLVERKIKTELFPAGSPHAGATAAGPPATRSIDTLVLRGQERRPMKLRGPLLGGAVASSDPAAPVPLVPPELEGEASLGWQGAQFVGLVAGPAEFPARLKGGIVEIGPLDMPVNEGRLTTAPRILLNEPVPQATIGAGPLIQNVRITPEMCNQWLKYVAPLLADATSAEGNFSLSLAGAHVPLFDPLASTVEGTLAIHGAQVGPGPLAKQYLEMGRQLKAIVDPTSATGDNYGRWLLLPEHNVAFAVRDGLVSHDGLTVTAQNFALTTKGHVRIADQAIDLDANIPIQDAWLQKDSSGLLASLRGQSVPLKVAGTLSQPRFDARPLQNLGQQLAGSAFQGLVDKNAAKLQGAIGKETEKLQGAIGKETEKLQGALDKEAGKLLEGLFGPKPKPRTTTPAP